MRVGQSKIQALIVFAIILSAGIVQAKNTFTHRFIRIALNSAKDASIADGKEILNRAAKVGYNGFFFDDSKVPYILTLGSGAINRMKDVFAHARSLNMVAIPMHFGQNTPATEDVKNAECFPVIGTPFAVSGNTATVQSDHSTGFQNGGFEGRTGWGLVGTGANIGAGGRSGQCLSFTNPKNARAIQAIKVKKQRAYKMSIWVKTANCGNPQGISIDIYDTNKRYYLLKRVYGSFSTWEDPWGSRPAGSQNWRQYAIDFYSFQSTDVAIWVRPAMVGKTNTGQVFFDDLTLQESGLFETTIRSTTPVIVKSEDGKTTYEEGKDFVVGDEKLSIPSGSAIKSGDKLRVDWFQRGDMIGTKSAASFCHGESWKYLWEHAEKTKEIFGEDGVWVKYSEWRTAFWDPACHKQYDNSLLKYMGGTQWLTNDMLRHVYGNCDLPLYLWNDNYDPYHNAKTGQYYQLNGIPHGSWDYLDPKTIIVNWNVHGRLASLMFFAGLGPATDFNGKPGGKTSIPLPQILNLNQGNTSPVSGWLHKLDSAEALGLPDGAVIGVNYCTWGDNYYGNVEHFASVAKKKGRWLSGPIPKTKPTTGCELTLPDTTLAGTGTVVKIAQDQNLLPLAKVGVSHATGHEGIRIQYTMEMDGHVQLSLFNPLGQKAYTFVDSHKEAGVHQMDVKKSNLPPGIYFLTLSQKGQNSRITRKIVLM